MRIAQIETPEGLLPAHGLSEDQLGETAQDPQIGDIIAIYSRGGYRAAKIEKIGPKRIATIYTTAGAFTTAQRIADINHTASAEASKAADLKLAAEYREKADQIERGEPTEREYWRRDHTPEEYAAQLRKWADDYEGKDWDAMFEKAAAQDAEPREQRILNAIHTTRKSIPKAEAFEIAGLTQEEA